MSSTYAVRLLTIKQREALIAIVEAKSVRRLKCRWKADDFVFGFLTINSLFDLGLLRIIVSNVENRWHNKRPTHSSLMLAKPTKRGLAYYESLIEHRNRERFSTLDIGSLQEGQGHVENLSNAAGSTERTDPSQTANRAKLPAVV